MAKAKATETTYNAEAEAPEPKPTMVDGRDDQERIADIKRANADRVNSLAKEIESGKPSLIHPIVVTDLAFAVSYIEKLERKIRLYEKNLEPVEV